MKNLLAFSYDQTRQLFEFSFKFDFHWKGQGGSE